VGLVNLKTSITCNYNSITRLLVLNNAVVSTLPGNSGVSFTVNSFLNPYSGVEKAGFQISTMEETGTGIKDQSTILAITVSTFATLVNPLLARADAMTTVNELSALTFTFSLNLPVDPDCRLRIVFPVDQPLTTDMSSSSGKNLFSSAYGLATLDLENNFAEVAGCPNYVDTATAM
jgi:hypothetical protein